MKKLLSVFLLLSITVASYAAIHGDVNGDGEITAADITALYDYLLNNDTSNLVHGDCNGDGNITAADVTAVYDVLLGNYQPNSVIEYHVNGVTFKMVEVQGGTFTMGATAEQGSDAESDESPTHQVTLSSFYIGQTEVTQELWEAVMGNNPSYHKGDVNYPVENVSWVDCQQFIFKLRQLTGLRFRLLTEAEWEFAARGGNKSMGYKYAGSNDINSVAWYKDNSGSVTHTVGTKDSNELGIYDMSGNVWEWCQDYWTEYTSESQINPTGPDEGEYLVLRGGSRIDIAKSCRVSVHNCKRVMTHKTANIGLRIALTNENSLVSTTASVVSVSDINLISAVANCKFIGIDKCMDCGVIVKNGNNKLIFTAQTIEGEQQVMLTGLKPWKTYQCYAYVKVGDTYIYEQEAITFSTPDLAGTWSCTEFFDNNQSESSTIVLTADGKATFTHVSGYLFMAHTTNTGSWNVQNDGSIKISFSDSSGSSWPMYYSKGFTGTFDNLINPTSIAGNATRNWGSTENHLTYGTFSMTRQP